MCRVRECSQCGEMSEYEYSDEEWEERGCICELCEQENEDEELVALGIL